MADRPSAGFIAYFLRSYPFATAGMVILLLLAGLAEGVGIAALLPVLEVAGEVSGVRGGGGAAMSAGANVGVAADRGAPGGSGSGAAVGASEGATLGSGAGLGPGAGAAGGATGSGEDAPLAAATARLLNAVGLEPTLATLLALIVAALVLKAVFRWLAMKRVGYTVAEVASHLRLRLVRALLAARWSYFAGQPAGAFAAAVSRDAIWAGYAYRHACAALAGLIQLAVYSVLVVCVSWRVGVLAVVAGGLMAVVLGVFVGMSRRAGREQTAGTAALAARLTDVVQGMKAVRAMGVEERVLPWLVRETESLRAAERRQALAIESLHSFQEPLVAALLAVGVYGGVVWAGHSLAAVLLLVFLFYRAAGRLHVVQTEYQGVAAAESAFWSLDARCREAEAAREPAGAGRAPPLVRQGIALREVWFAYGERPVLRGLSLWIPAGAFVAIAGPSGAGKTTVADLILGLQRAGSGEVLVDGEPLDGLDLGAWRRMVGYVPQETLLFHDTVARNVTMGDDGVPVDEVERALREAGTWELVARLPQGVDTVVGERGARLSGGERQRVALARALLRRPRLLVLDEATTGLDAEAEAAICETLRGLRGRVTIVAVSHRPALVDAADVVYQIRDGVAVEQRRAATVGAASE